MMGVIVAGIFSSKEISRRVETAEIPVQHIS
jgi:hypothetical protein